MSENRHFKNELPAYLSGGLTEAQRREVEAHLLVCDSCRAHLDKVRAKQERFKREASGHGIPTKVPNLLLTRLGRQAGLDDHRERPSLGVMIAAICALGLVAYIIGKKEGPLFKMGAPKGVSGKQSGTPAQTPAANVPPEVTLSTSTPMPGAPGVSSTQAPAAKPASQPKGAVANAPVTSTGITAPQGRVVRRGVEYRGSFSTVRKAQEVVIRDPAAWERWWRLLDREWIVPKIDFNSQMVAGIFVGEKPSRGYVVDFGPIRETNDAIVIPYKITQPTQEQAEAAVTTNPYRLLVLPRSDKKVAFEH
jgi:hypothetical protein